MRKCGSSRRRLTLVDGTRVEIHLADHLHGGLIQVVRRPLFVRSIKQQAVIVRIRYAKLVPDHEQGACAGVQLLFAYRGRAGRIQIDANDPRGNLPRTEGRIPNQNATAL